MTGGNSVGIAWRRVAWSALCLLLLMPILTRPGPLPAWDAVLRLGALSGLLLACLAEWGVLRARGVLVVSAVGCLALGCVGLGSAAGVHLADSSGRARAAPGALVAPAAHVRRRARAQRTPRPVRGRRGAAHPGPHAGRRALRSRGRGRRGDRPGQTG